MVFTCSTPLTSANSMAFIVIVALFLLISPSHSSSSRSSTGGLVVEEKARIVVGSTPPNCQHRCNMCHPCMAVQVPTAPSRGRVEPSSVRDHSDNDWSSNYKPLGWKCRCEGHFYNP